MNNSPFFGAITRELNEINALCLEVSCAHGLVETSTNFSISL